MTKSTNPHHRQHAFFDAGLRSLSYDRAANILVLQARDGQRMFVALAFATMDRALGMQRATSDSTSRLAPPPDSAARSAATRRRTFVAWLLDNKVVLTDHRAYTDAMKRYLKEKPDDALHPVSRQTAIRWVSRTQAALFPKPGTLIIDDGEDYAWAYAGAYLDALRKMKS